jgi:uncharacterized FlaG/YvyC family protein
MPRTATPKTEIPYDSHAFIDALYLNKVKRANHADNAPMPTIGQFGKSGIPNYYYGDEPTPYELYKIARYTPIGYRLTWGLNNHVFNNKWVYQFPIMDMELAKAKNQRLEKHWTKTHFYLESKRATGFDYEQGESLLLMYREGDGVELEITAKPSAITDINKPISATQDTPRMYDSVRYNTLEQPADINKKVIRYEAISKMDYMIPTIDQFGAPQYYLITFYDKNNTRISYKIHSSRVVRWKTNPIDYDQYVGQAKTKPCFMQLQILANIDRMAGIGVSRWALGIPFVFTKGIKPNDIDKFTAAIGDPTSQTWVLAPSENIVDVKNMGITGTAIDLPGISQMEINQCAAASGIPASILMNEKAGVIGSGEVNERAYFSVLDQEHTNLNPLFLEVYRLDPEAQSELANTNYVQDWGLRQVMTKREQAEYDGLLASNAVQMSSYLDMDEIRTMLGKPKLEDHWKGKEKQVEFLFGPQMTPEILGMVIPRLGELRQAYTNEILESPAEQQAQNTGEMLQNNQTQQVQKQQAANTTEAARRERKSLQREMDLGLDETLEQLVMGKIHLMLDKQRGDKSIKTIAKDIGIAEETLYKVLNFVKEKELSK